MIQRWLQDHVSKGNLRIQKTNTGENLADAMTKHLHREGIGQRIQGTHSTNRNGRHELSPEVSKPEGSSEVNMIVTDESSVNRIQWTW